MRWIAPLAALLLVCACATRTDRPMEPHPPAPASASAAEASASPLALGGGTAPGPVALGAATAGGAGITARTAAPAAGAAAEAGEDGPWRIEEALGLPEWLELSGQQRTRFEHLSDEFRVIGRSPNYLLALRTLLKATAHYNPLRVTVEMMDSRAYFSPDGGFISNSVVDALALLQGFVAYREADVFRADDTLDVLAGRYTMNVGSRRFVSRNGFRNTINAFTGLNGLWTGGANESVRAFVVVPVRRLPLRPDDLYDNEIVADEELSGTYFYGLHTAFPLFGESDAEAYAFYLDESDRDDILTRDRTLWTVGTRLREVTAPGGFGYEWEGALQFGHSKLVTNPNSNTDLAHWAQFFHISGSYEFDSAWRPRVEAMFDYASGDRNPNDGSNNRFDTLYGSRGFEYGPTGIFGPFTRSNEVSPGVRMRVDPSPTTALVAAYRLHWLASDRDFWTTSGLVDPTGNSGSFVGQLIEFHVSQEILPGNFRLDAGIAHLFAGDFIENAPNATTQGDTTYVYVASIITF